MPQIAEYLAQFDARLLATTEGRRVLTRLNPKLFAVVYLSKHMTDASGEITFSEVHDDWYMQMREWIRPANKPREWRKAFVAPRSMGKSTTWFLAGPLWAGAHGHSTFTAAFADSAGQSENHLATLKAELATNKLLQKDFPEFCTPSRRPGGQTESDNRSMIKMSNGFVFAAKGVDSSSLGMKAGASRPDLLIFDDIEPSASNYSPFQAEKRLDTIVNALLPLNENARVAVVGTVTMPESIIHQLVKTVTSTDPVAQWILDEKFKTHYYKPIVDNEDGTRRSVWPEKWALEFLSGIETTKAYMLNYLNDPLGNEGGFWTKDDFIYEKAENMTRVMITCDPAVTTKTSSDYTGLAVVGWSPVTGKTYVLHAEQIKATGRGIRDRIAGLMEDFPMAKLLLVEVNQGGDLWAEAFDSLPIKKHFQNATVKKEVRAALAHAEYQKGLVVHDHPIPVVENQMVSFPRVVNDDVVDAVGAGILFFVEANKGTPSVQASAGKYR